MSAFFYIDEIEGVSRYKKMRPLKWKIMSVSTNKLSRFFAEHGIRFVQIFRGYGSKSNILVFVLGFTGNLHINKLRADNNKL